MTKEQFMRDMLHGRDCNEDCGNCPYNKSEFCRTERQTDEILKKYFVKKPKDKTFDVIKAMLSKFGEDSQIEVAIEEMAELTKELIKYMRSKIHEQEKTATRREHVVEEIGDVLFMIQYLTVIFNIDENELIDIMAEKVERTRLRYIIGMSEQDFRKWIAKHQTKTDAFPQCKYTGCEAASVKSCYTCPNRLEDISND